ncbi:MAG: hypothetical protein IJI05_01795 [Erysipelotrichaceae bacterium]|nr:hypothetical protein [Erysipelotrichaceae bacterium]
MNKRALDILADAISDAGAWQWWHLENDMLQLEFCDVQLYDGYKAENDIHTMDVMAVRFSGNVFAVFLDDLDEDEEKPWYERFYDDEIIAFDCDAYELEFDNPEYAQKVHDGYRNKAPMTPFDGMNTLNKASHLIAVKCGDVGIVAGGDQIRILSKNAVISEEEIEPMSRKWWEYWKRYWKLRGTKEALPKDRTCEVTIPVNMDDPEGVW